MTQKNCTILKYVKNKFYFIKILLSSKLKIFKKNKNREVRYSAEYGFCRLCYLMLLRMVFMFYFSMWHVRSKKGPIRGISRHILDFASRFEHIMYQYIMYLVCDWKWYVVVETNRVIGKIFQTVIPPTTRYNWVDTRGSYFDTSSMLIMPLQKYYIEKIKK